MAITTNTANTTVTDRTASGNQPDNTPATGTTTGGSGGSGVSSVSSGSSNVTVTSSGGGGTGAVTISVSGGSGTGNVTGSGTTTVGHVAVFNNISATGIQDGGPASLTIAGNSVSLGGSVSQDSITGLAATTAGIVKHTATANTLGIAVAADFPTLNQNTTGNAATVTGLSVVSGKTLTANNTLTLSGTDGSTLAIGGGGTLGSAAYTASTAYVAASSGTATNLTLVGTLKDSNSSSAGSSGQVLSSLGTGTKWITPSSGGNVTGTSPTASGNVAVFNNTTGTGIADGGTLGTAAFTASTAYVSATTAQTAHKFLAGPTTGTAAPTFRVIDPTDVPTLNQSTTGNAATATTATTATTAGNVTGIVAVANGGTGTSGPSLINGTGISVTGSWPNQTITNTTSAVPSGGTQGQRLIKDSTNAVAWGNDPYLYAEDYGYGLSGNTVTQDTTALQNAVNAAATANATLLIPAGSIHINSAIVIGSVASGYTGRLRIMGCGRKNTRVIQDSAVDGFTFFMADPITCDNAIEINDIGIIGNNNSAATAINIIFPYSGNNGARTCVMVHGIEATGVIGAGSVITQTGGWTNGLAMYSCWAGVVYDCYFGGVIAETIMSGGSYATSGVGSGSGVLISGCINVELTDITSEWFYRGISIPATSVAWSSGSSYSVGTIVSYSGLYYLCYTAIGSSTTAPSSDTSHFIRTRLQSEGIVMDNMTVVSAINALYAESTFVYLTNFLFDNGNFTNNNFISVNLVNARSAYLVGGQVLQNGNANQVKINGGTAVTMSNVDFTQQANMSGASVLITNSATNCVVTGCIFAGQPAVQCDSGTSGCKAPSNIYGTGANIDSGTNYLGDSLGFQTVVTLTGGSATETKNVDISRCKLGRQPDGGVAQVVSDTGIACLYYWQDTGNTKSNLVLQFFMFNGTTLPNAGVRYSLRVGP